MSPLRVILGKRGNAETEANETDDGEGLTNDPALGLPSRAIGAGDLGNGRAAQQDFDCHLAVAARHRERK